MEIYNSLESKASKEFQELLKSQLSKTKNLAEGKIIEGKITKITEKFVFLFIEGLKSEPVLDINELKTIQTDGVSFYPPITALELFTSLSPNK